MESNQEHERTEITFDQLPEEIQRKWEETEFRGISEMRKYLKDRQAEDIRYPHFMHRIFY
tara:strand:- start:582 stop:761 length:180 start_codon:yes stop_codon:yes gene_type:complete